MSKSIINKLNEIDRFYENEEKTDKIITYLLEHQYGYKYKDIKQMTFNKKAQIILKKFRAKK